MGKIVNKGTLIITWGPRVSRSFPIKGVDSFKNVNQDNVSIILGKRNKDNIKSAVFHNRNTVTAPTVYINNK